MKKLNPYAEGHLVVAAIRVLDHQKNMPPSVEDVGALLSVSREQAYRMCNKLNDRGIIKILEGPFGNKVDILDHVQLEEIPQEDLAPGMEAELEKFRQQRKGITEKVENIKAEREEKKKSLFADIEKAFKSKTVKPPSNE
ncbi:MAG: helix-turn-helix domain-containing protein [Pseudomonadota bacterium]